MAHVATATLVMAVLTACSGTAVDQLSAPTAAPAPTFTTPVAPPPTVQASVASPHPARTTTPPVATRPATAPPTTTTTVVRDGDTGRTLRLRVGQQLRVVLTDGTWDPPESGSPAVVRRSSVGGYPSDQPVDALFEAVRTGTADLTTQSDAACFHSEPRCLMPTRLWQVHLVVS